MSSNIGKSEKWYKPYDPIVWGALLVVFIGFFMYRGNNSGYNQEEIQFNNDITTIKEAIDETDKIVKEKYGDKYKLCGVTGYSNNIQNETNVQPDLTISYLQSKGLGNKSIDYSISLEDDKITNTYITRNSIFDRKDKFYYNSDKLDIPKILNIVEGKVDMEKLRSGYEPNLNFYAYKDEMTISMEYYKNMKSSGVDYESRVSYTFVVDMKTHKIKSESVDGIANS